MRTRHLKPSLFENEVLGSDSADPIYTILFEGLWCLADREGRLKDRPELIKSKILPYRTCPDPDAKLQWLADRGLIVRYSVDGERYIWIPKFKQHQKPHQNESPSVIPEYTELAKTSTNGASASTNYASTWLLTLILNLNSYSELRSGEPPATPPDSDPVELRIWKDGLDLMKRSGLNEKAARPLLGRLAKDHGKLALAASIAVTQAENPADPRAFLIGELKRRSGKNRKADPGKSQPEISEADQELIRRDLLETECVICQQTGCSTTHSEEEVKEAMNRAFTKKAA